MANLKEHNPVAHDYLNAIDHKCWVYTMLHDPTIFISNRQGMRNAKSQKMLQATGDLTSGLMEYDATTIQKVKMQGSVIICQHHLIH